VAYFPNGSAVAVLLDQCANCPLGQKLCPVLIVQNEFNYEQDGNASLRAAMNLLVNEAGKCQVFEQLVPDS
jgi:hypothetical protein